MDECIEEYLNTKCVNCACLFDKFKLKSSCRRSLFHNRDYALDVLRFYDLHDLADLFFSNSNCLNGLFLCRKCHSLFARYTSENKKLLDLKQELSSNNCMFVTMKRKRHEAITPERAHSSHLALFCSPSPPPKRKALFPTPRKYLADSPHVSVKVTYKSRSVRVSHLPPKSSIKGIVRNLVAKRFKAAVKMAFRHPDLKNVIMQHVQKTLQAECTKISSSKRPSILRSSEMATRFDFKKVVEEFEEKAPLTLSLYRSIPPKKSYTQRQMTDLKIATVMCILLNGVNVRLNAFQKFTGLLLYRGKASDKTFRRLNALGITVSRATVITMVNSIAEDFDKPVLEWKGLIEQQNACGYEGDHSYASNACASHPDELYIADENQIDECERCESPPSVRRVNTHSTPIQSSSSSSTLHISQDLGVAAFEEISPILSETLKNKDVFFGPHQPRLAHGFQIVFDNINIGKKAHAKSNTRNTHLDLVHGFAVLDDVNVEHLDDSQPITDVMTVPNSAFLVNKSEHQEIKNHLCILVQRSLVSHIPFFAEYCADFVVHHIPHCYQDLMASKSRIIPLGILEKNEMKSEDMIEILQHYHQYVPEVQGKLHSVPLGGDGLSVLHGLGAKAARRDGDNTADSLQGLVLKSEDWHKDTITVLQDIFNTFYSEKSTTQKGTLYQIKCRFDTRRNVKQDVKQAVDADRELLEFTTHVYICLAALHLLDMRFDGTPNPKPEPEDLKNFFIKIAEDVVNLVFIPYSSLPKVDNAQGATKQIPRVKCPNINCPKTFAKAGQHLQKHIELCPYKHPNSSTAEVTTAIREKFPCGFPGCPKDFVIDGRNRKKHREVCPFQQVSDQESVSETTQPPQAASIDRVKAYSCALLREGLMDMARHDAVREGDGQRIVLYWKLDMLSFYALKHKNYAKLAFMLQAQLNSVCSFRMAAKIAWNRTVNVHGGRGNRISLDKCMEILNREVKPELNNKGGTLTSATIKRVGRSLRVVKEIEQHMDKSIKFFSGIGEHKASEYKTQLPTLVKELHQQHLFHEIEGRYHAAFPHFNGNPYCNIVADELNSWFNKKKAEMYKLQQCSVFK